MSTTHTPGPLVVRGDEVGYISKEDDQSFGMFCPIAIVFKDADRPLISAVHELFDAADNALNTLIACCIPAGGVDDRKAILDAQMMLRQAIAKATGAQS